MSLRKSYRHLGLVARKKIRQARLWIGESTNPPRSRLTTVVSLLRQSHFMSKLKADSGAAKGLPASHRATRLTSGLVVSTTLLALLASGCGCRDYTDCELQDNGDYECYAPTCPEAEQSDLPTGFLAQSTP